MQRVWLGAAVAAGLLAAPSVWGQTDMRPAPRPGSEVLLASDGIVEAQPGEDPAPEALADDPDAADETPTALAIASLARDPLPRPADLFRGHELRLALTYVGRDDWDMARRVAGPEGSVARDIVEWMRLRSGEGAFADYRAFLAKNGDWPGLALLRRRGEAAIPDDADPARVIGYFKDMAPQTGRGAFRLAQALDATGAGDKAKAEILRAWRELEMTATEEAEILGAWRDTVAPAHPARLDMLLWRKDRNGVLRAMGRVDDGWKALAEARLALQREDAGVDALIDKVPAALRGNGGLAFDRFIWRIEKGRRDEAADLMIEQSTSAEALGRPLEWANWRRILARQAMRDGDGRRAYALASRHHIPASVEDYDYSDLEWLAGYVALRYLDDPATALTHFERFTESVFTAISLGRGYYWEGRALEAMGDAEAAQAAYRKGGAHQSSFYGLLAAEKAGMQLDPVLAGRDPETDWEKAAFMSSSVRKAAEAWHGAGQQWETVRFLSQLAENVPERDLVALTDYAASLGDPFITVRVAKQAAREGVIAPRAYFPLVGLGVDLPVEEALALSIARRESEFNVAATSPAGARGLMQLMPGTAKLVSARLGMPYVLGRLTTDGPYNATLGSAYLASLIEEFGPNYALVAAGYNAGPGRPRRWVGDYGDPRYPGTDPVDWVELIPFRETRDYVMRVTESVPIYRARLTGESGPIGLTKILTAR